MKVMQCYFKKYTLHFKKPGGTSRGVLHHKDTYFIFLKQGDNIAVVSVTGLQDFLVTTEKAMNKNFRKYVTGYLMKKKHC
ncbi:MAG: hypothetical protein R2847_01975 [Bacteroidia bacterium]